MNGNGFGTMVKIRMGGGREWMHFELRNVFFVIFIHPLPTDCIGFHLIYEWVKI